MIGVGETTPGVREGMGVQTGNGCGLTVQVSQPDKASINKRIKKSFFIPSILLLYLVQAG
jgi:hypothetical protein